MKAGSLSGPLEDPFPVIQQTLYTLLECDKDYCKQKYIGITHQELCERIYQHGGYVRNTHLNRATC